MHAVLKRDFKLTIDKKLIVDIEIMNKVTNYVFVFAGLAHTTD